MQWRSTLKLYEKLAIKKGKYNKLAFLRSEAGDYKLIFPHIKRKKFQFFFYFLLGI